MKGSIKPLLFCCFSIIIISLIMPAYAEVTSLKTDKTFYKKGEKITFSGTLEPSDINAIVSIRVRDSHGTLAVFRQTFSDADQNFKLDIDTSNRDFQFDTHGIYTATAFLNNLAYGVEVNFDFSLDGSPVLHPEEPAPTTTSTPTSPPTSGTTTPTQETDDDSEKSIEEKIQERIEAAKKQGSQTTSTSDSEKSIEEKIQERIEAAKKEGAQTTEKTDSTGDAPPTGDTSSETTTEEKTDATGINIPLSSDSVLYVAIGLGSAAAVVGAVYGMKHKPKFMTRDILEETAVEQVQQPDSQTTHEEDYALMILKNRLAKGEITIEEYNELKRALKEP